MRVARRTECTKAEDCPARLHRAGCRRVYLQVLQIEQEKREAQCSHHSFTVEISKSLLTCMCGARWRIAERQESRYTSE